MLATFAWLAAALRWRTWYLHPGQTLVVTLLATFAWSIRGAGIVCVATTLLYPLGAMIWTLVRREQAAQVVRRVVGIVVIFLIIAAYQGTLKALSPEKALASGQQSANSYTDQLLTGLTDGHRLSVARPGDWLKLVTNFRNLMLDHFGDFSSSFVPWPRENPDFHFRVYIGKSFALFGLLGWLWHATRLKRATADNQETPAAVSADGASTRFLDLFVLLYISLYLVWPFDFARFWSPILPVMLVYGADAVIRFSDRRGRIQKVLAAAPAVLLLGLLFLLNSVEDFVQLGNYARRLNYVSDSLASGVSTIIHRSPDPAITYVAVMNGDDHFALAWYFTQAQGPQGEPQGGRRYVPYSPAAHVEAKGGAAETVEELIVRLMETAATATKDGENDMKEPRVYLFSYFAHRDAEGVFANLRQTHPEAMAAWTVEKVRQQEIIMAVWEIRPRRAASTEK